MLKIVDDNQMFFWFVVLTEQYVHLYSTLRRLRCEKFACRTSNIKRHFETKHEKLFKDDSKKIEAFRKAIFSISKKSFAIGLQMKIRKVATQLQSSAKCGLLRHYIT